MDKPVHYRINSPKVIHETIDGETVIVNLDSGNYYSLDSVGADIWECLTKNMPAHSIVDTIAFRYAGEREAIEKALKQFIEEIQLENLIVIDQTPAALSSVRNEAGQMKDRSIFTAPVLNRYSDMQELLLLDPIHEVDDTGWPNIKTDNP